MPRASSCVKKGHTWLASMRRPVSRGSSAFIRRYRCCYPTRTSEDFARHLARTVATDPEAGWIFFVVDQLNACQSELLVRFVAEQCLIPPRSRRRGRIRNTRFMASRRTFLADPTHRSRFIYTPSVVQHPGSPVAQAGEFHLG
jgi:hypothetical protein